MEKLYLLRQIVTIIGLYLSGGLFIRLLENSLIKHHSEKNTYADRLLEVLLAYPLGLSLWGLTGFMLLIACIPYTLVSIGIVYALIYSLLLVVGILRTRKLTSSGKAVYGKQEMSYVNHNYKGAALGILLLFAVAILAYVCCSGLLPVSLSNDSYYYYSVYPQTIVAERSYLRCFDVFLTDVGQTTALIGALPWFFGFEQVYGIQLFLGFNLIGIYAYAVYALTDRMIADRVQSSSAAKCKLIVTLVSTLFLTLSTPFIVMTRWILANAYFMTFLFLIFVLLIRIADEKSDNGFRDMIIVGMLTAMLSMMRMEGGMMAGLLILSACALKKLSNRFLICAMTLPVGITQALYYATVYLRLKVDPLYSFLSTTNVFVMLGFVAVILVYLSVFRQKRLLKLQEHYSYLMPGMLLLGNMAIAVISPQRYTGNLRFFIQNIVHQNGWGFFGIFVLTILLLLPLGKIEKELSFSTLFTLGFVLFTIAVCWARDGTLREGIGDSGNRVLLQIVPFVCYCLTERIVKLLYWDNK